MWTEVEVKDSSENVENGPVVDGKALTGWLLHKGLLSNIRVESRLNDGISEIPVWSALRPYQKEAVRLAVGACRGIVAVPCGGGKTMIALGIAQANHAMGISTIYLVPNRELARQAQKTLGQWGKAVSYKSLEAKEGAFSSLSEGMGKGLGKGLALIVDECHTIGARGRSLVFSRLHDLFNVVHCVGMSATPLARSDNKNNLVIGLIGPVVYSISIADLNLDGYLTKGKVILCPFH